MNETLFLYASAEAKGRSPDVPHCSQPVFTWYISIPWKFLSLQSLRARAQRDWQKGRNIYTKHRHAVSWISEGKSACGGYKLLGIGVEKQLCP